MFGHITRGEGGSQAPPLDPSLQTRPSASAFTLPPVIDTATQYTVRKTNVDPRPQLFPFKATILVKNLETPCPFVDLGITMVSVLQNTRGSTLGREKGHFSEKTCVTSKSRDFSRKFERKGFCFNDF